MSCVGRLEVEGHIPESEDSAGSEDGMNPIKGERLPEVRQMMECIAGVDKVDWLIEMLVRQNPACTGSTLSM